MGCFGYICNGCKTQIVGNCFEGGELAVLKHIRHGEVIGEVTGHYNEYGTVIGQNKKTGFRGEKDSLPNSHHEICRSEFDMHDSRKYGREKRIYDGQLVTASSYETIRITEEILKLFESGVKPDDKLVKNLYLNTDVYDEEFEMLPIHEDKTTPRSGIEAWHKKCYDESPQEMKDAHIISDGDPDQSWGEVREEFN